MAEHRKDSKGRVLKEGESERKTGGYQFRYPLLNGKRGYLYARTLTELREKEESLKKDQYDGIRVDKRNLTMNIQ